MRTETKEAIKILITNKIQNKLNDYDPESSYAPFFEAIFDKSVIIQASVMQSLYTSFGMSIYEQIAILLSQEAGYKAVRQYQLPGSIDSSTESLITEICSKPHGISNKLEDIQRIRYSIRSSPPTLTDPERVVDVFVKKADGSEVYVDITTVKPNLKEFRALRKKMLRWCALKFSQDIDANVSTYIGIPYNPYYPNEYARWTSKECDMAHDVRIQNDLWQEFAGYDVFDELIQIFEEVGEELREKISTFLEGQ